MRMCSIASGSSGNCIYVGSDNTHLLVDTGISKKRIEEGLKTLDLKGDDLNGILITHEHSDHIQGLGAFSRKYQVPIYATKGTLEGIKSYSGLGKMPEGLYHPIHTDEPFTLGDIDIHPFEISHDANEPAGYRLECGAKSVAVATDLGKYDSYTVKNLQNLDAVLLEANHDIHIMLGHLSRENNYAKLAYETVKLEVTLAENEYKGEDLDMFVASRDSVSEIVTV